MEREGFQMNTIAERIKFAMKAKNKKQVDIVKDTGISKGAFSSYLSGQYNPKADKMELIADSLDVDLRWLYGQNVPMEHTSQNDNALQYVFYNNSCSEYLLDDLDDIYRQKRRERIDANIDNNFIIYVPVLIKTEVFSNENYLIRKDKNIKFLYIKDGCRVYFFRCRYY